MIKDLVNLRWNKKVKIERSRIIVLVFLLLSNNYYSFSFWGGGGERQLKIRNGRFEEQNDRDDHRPYCVS